MKVSPILVQTNPKNKQNNSLSFGTLNLKSAKIEVNDYLGMIPSGKTEKLRLAKILRDAVDAFAEKVKNDKLPEIELDSLRINWMGENSSEIIADGSFAPEQIAKAKEHSVSLPGLVAVKDLQDINDSETVASLVTEALNNFYQKAQGYLKNL